MSRETVNEAVQASDAIAALDTPTASDYWWALHGYSPEAIGAAALANGGGGGGGGGAVLTILGPDNVPYNDPDAVNPANNLGKKLGMTIPAGSIVFDLFPVQKSVWTGASAGDLFSFVAAPPDAVDNTDALSLANYDLNSPGGSIIPSSGFYEPDAWHDAPPASTSSAYNTMKRFVAVVELAIYVALWPSGTLSAGSIDVYALIRSGA